MSRQDNNPRIVVAMHNATEEAIEAVKNQTYSSFGSITLHVNETQDKAPKFFNDVIQNKTIEADLYAFIDGNCILDKKCLETVAAKFLWSEDQFFGAAYSDYSLVQDNIESNQYYFSYNLKTLKQNVINPFIFINGKIMTRIFNENLETLYYYDALIKIGMNAMIYHIPKKLMKVYNTPKDIEKDLQRLSGNVRS